MELRSKLLILFVVVLCGCASSHFRKGMGDVGQFIIQQAVARGGTPVNTNNLPVVNGKWSFYEDQYGIVVRLPREEFPAVESVLRASFGEPKIEPAKTDNAVKFGAYRLTDKGGGIQFTCDTKETQVIIVRPLSQKEFSESLNRAIQDKEFQKALQNSANKTD